MKARVRGLQRVRVDVAGCLDRCGLGPSLVIYPEWIWYRVESTTDTILNDICTRTSGSLN
jgi:(2Fe-2S) ferredoxin